MATVMAKNRTRKAKALAVAKKTTGKNKGKGQSKNDKGKGQDHMMSRLQSVIDDGIYLRVKIPPEGAGVVKLEESSE